MARSALTALLAAVLVLAGACSDDDSDPDQPSGTTADGSSSALPPVMVDSADDVTLSVGEFIDVVTEGADRATSSDPAVLEASDARTDGSAEFNAGAEALAPGSAVLGVYDGDDLLYEVDVTVGG